VSPTRVFDARVQLLADASPLRHGTRLRLYHGTRATNARMRLLDRKELSPGESVLARLMLQEGLVALPGDRFVLRSSSPQITVGGGTVLDPAPTSRRIDPGWLEALEGGDWGRVVPLALARAPKGGMSAGEISLVVPAGPSEISAAVEENPEVAKVGDLYAPAAELETARKRLLETLKKRAKERPESPELSVAEARTAAGLDARLADALLKEMAGGEIRIGDAGVSLSDADEVPPELEEEAEVLLKTLRRAGVEPPLAETTPAARLLLKRGEAVQLADGLFTSDEVAQNILEEIKTATRENGEISLADFRDRLGTSRKYAQAWLEYADTAGVTRRVGDARVLTRRYR
jgi:selenocysteine-specific elongation factor